VDVVQGEIDTVKADIEAKSESGELNAVAVLLTKIAQLEEKRDAVAQALQSEDLDNLDASHYMWCGPCNRLVTHDRFEIPPFRNSGAYFDPLSNTTGLRSGSGLSSC
jgi:hypothetical protein